MKHFDYSTPQAYFVTVCTGERKAALGQIREEGEKIVTELSPCGRIAEEELKALESRYPGLTVRCHAVMPDHIHAVICIPPAENAPDLRDVVCAFKSLTANRCRAELQVTGLFQTSFYEHVIRDRAELEQTEKYIADNPAARFYREKGGR